MKKILTKRLRNGVLLTVAALGLAGVTACHDIDDYQTDPQGVFSQLWTVMDEHYCFFAEKERMYRDEYAATPEGERGEAEWKRTWSWDEVRARYGAMISNEMSDEELFDVCAEMINELKDGHTNLSAPFNTSYYTKWWSDYPQNYNERIVEEYYFNFNYQSTGGIKYGILQENIGYVRYPSFSYAIGEGNLDAILAYCATCSGLIVDVRDNGGGSMTNVETLVGRFTDKSIKVGSICHKDGPGHDDFSKPFDYYINPAEKGRVMWGKPIVVLCNRSTFSAANNFVSVMKGLPNVTIVGSTTGGGSGMPFSSELANGWGIRFSASPVRDAQGELTEFGVEPDVAVDMDAEEALAGRDTMLDTAIRVASGGNAGN